MKRLVQAWIVIAAALLVSLAGFVTQSARARRSPASPRPPRPAPRVHVDHASFFASDALTPQGVTRRCLECHPAAAQEVMHTSHWEWLGPKELLPGRDEAVRIGKKNLLNNFCIGIQGNWPACTVCHIGYGWKDGSFDFTRSANVDCLACHDWTGTYVKGPAGMPAKSVDLVAVARSVGYPRRDNCGVCHYYGGGGLGVKHGDLDTSLNNPDAESDVHMGRYGFLCVDCHRARQHQIPGRAFSVSATDANGLACEACHQSPPHADARLNAHLSSVACASCHIPAFARDVPTKMSWDWSKAGDATRPDDPHTYLKIKGEFRYADNVTPEYRWFNRSVERYLLGDKIDPESTTFINRPRGDIHDRSARIWPFKVHQATQPYDAGYRTLSPVVTAGEGGYWHAFDWDQALRLGARVSGLPYSGRFGWARTQMFWPLSHEVAPKERALGCDDCHGPGGRMNWTALGYEGDPMQRGGRP